MKKIFFLLFLVILFSGCNDDDGNSAALIGVWISERQEITDCVEPTDNEQINRRCTDASCFKLTMNSDGTYAYQEGTPIERGTFSQNSGMISFCFDDDGEEICRTFSIDENTSVTLVLSTTDEITGCKTSDLFERLIEEELDDEA